MVPEYPNTENARRGVGPLDASAIDAPRRRASPLYRANRGSQTN